MTQSTATPEMLHDPDAEESVIGCAILDSSCVHTFELAEADFYLPQWRLAWRAICDLVFVDKEPVDPTTVCSRLLRDGHTVPKEADLLQCAARVATAANAWKYAKDVRAFAVKRRVYTELLRQSREVLKTGPEEVIDAVDTMQRAVIAACDVRARIEPARVGAAALKQRLVAATGPLEPFVPTGLQKLDNRVGGVLLGHITLLAARPSVGKSACARAMADNQASAGVPVGIISVEDKRDRILLGIACKRAMVDVRRAMLGQLRSSEQERLSRELDRVGELPLYISDERPLTPRQACQRMRQLKADHGVQTIYLDYWNRLKLPKASRGSSRREDATEFVNDMSDAADSLGVALVILAQLNRDVEKEMRRPRLIDLKETGGLEEIGESVIFLHREVLLRPDAKAITRGWEAANELEAIVAKWKTAPHFRALLYWVGRCLSVTDEEPDDPDAPAEKRQQSFGCAK